MSKSPIDTRLLKANALVKGKVVTKRLYLNKSGRTKPLSYLMRPYDKNEMISDDMKEPTNQDNHLQKYIESKFIIGFHTIQVAGVKTFETCSFKTPEVEIASTSFELGTKICTLFLTGSNDVYPYGFASEDMPHYFKFTPPPEKSKMISIRFIPYFLKPDFCYNQVYKFNYISHMVNAKTVLTTCTITSDRGITLPFKIKEEVNIKPTIDRTKVLVTITGINASHFADILPSKMVVSKLKLNQIIINAMYLPKLKKKAEKYNCTIETESIKKDYTYDQIKIISKLSNEATAKAIIQYNLIMSHSLPA